MTYHSILRECQKERDSVRQMIKDVNKKAGWFIGSALVKKEKENAQNNIIRMYIKLITENISELRDELDDYDFAPVYDIYTKACDGEEITIDELPDELRLK